MPRYFIELSYRGTAYSGFQIQDNAITIQSELEKALFILYKTTFELTGSSRTDAGVHAHQNFFHFDTEIKIIKKNIYNLNAILPKDIVVKNIYNVSNDTHCRFDADCRSYQYFIYQTKNPFKEDFAYFFPFKIDENLLHQTAELFKQNSDFTSFSKKHTQVNNFNCTLLESYWCRENDYLIYNVKGNRFLRGMVRSLVATQLRVARGLATLEDFKNIIASKDCNKAYFEAPAQGLFLKQVVYPEGLMKEVE